MGIICNWLAAGAGGGEPTAYRIRIVYDNTSAVKGCTADWGFSCLINGSLLFDTGKSFEILSQNMQFLGIEPQGIKKIVISHNHNDHYGGLHDLLGKIAPGAEVFGTGDFMARLHGKPFGAILHSIEKTIEIGRGIYALEPIPCSYTGGKLLETVVVLAKANEICIITGCAHPGLKIIVDKVKAVFPGKRIGLLMGGFHLFDTKNSELEEIAAYLKESGVGKVAPVHCTGKSSIEYLRNAFGAEFLEGGAGKEIRF